MLQYQLYQQQFSSQSVKTEDGDGMPLTLNSGVGVSTGTNRHVLVVA
jgi:hypothetical protein